MLTTLVVIAAVFVVLAAVGLVGIACCAVGARQDRVPPYAKMAFGPDGVSLICSHCSAVSGPFPVSSELTAADMPCNCSTAPGRSHRRHAA